MTGLSRSAFVLLGAQFLTALADNALLFAAIAMLIDAAARGTYRVASAFLLALVAPPRGPTLPTLSEAACC